MNAVINWLTEIWSYYYENFFGSCGWHCQWPDYAIGIFIGLIVIAFVLFVSYIAVTKIA